MELQANPVSRVYAQALFGVAKDRDAVDDIGAGLHGLVEAVRHHPDFHHFLAAPMIDASHKKAVVEKALHGNVDAVLVDFLCLLIDRNREQALEGVAQQFQLLADVDARRVRVAASTPQPLSEGQRHQVLESLQHSLQRDCALEEKVEPELIGGMVLRIGDTLYDGSVRRALQRVGDQLMRSSGYEN